MWLEKFVDTAIQKPFLSQTGKDVDEENQKSRMVRLPPEVMTSPVYASRQVFLFVMNVVIFFPFALNGVSAKAQNFAVQSDSQFTSRKNIKPKRHREFFIEGVE